jgi:citrate synthase
LHYIDSEAYLTAGEAAGLLGIKASTLYAYVSRGLVRSYRQGIKRRRLYRERELRRILHLRPSGGQARLPHAADWIGDP